MNPDQRAATKETRLGVALLALLPLGAILQAPDRPARRQEQARAAAQAWKGEPGVFVRKREADEFKFFRWAGEGTVNRALLSLKAAGGGELRFGPGTYTVGQGFRLAKVPDLTISGAPGAVLEFADGPEKAPLTTADVGEGDTVLYVDRPEQMRVGWRYQVYSPERRGARVLEFQVDSVEGNAVHLTKPVRFMPLVKRIPKGSDVLEEMNFFRAIDCPRLVIQNLTMDGKRRGPVRGHTTYGGVYVTGDYHKGERPVTSGLTVRGCTFRDLMGRGVCAYGVGDILIEDCAFYDTFAQAMEIDHYSSGRVVGNLVRNAEVGVMLNDCFDSVVEANRFEGCKTGVRIARIFPEEWVNTGNVVRDNVIGPDCERGVAIEDLEGSGVRGNVVRRNHFLELDEESRVIDPFGNDVRQNTHAP